MKKALLFATLLLFAAGAAFGGTITVSQPAGGSFAMGAACPVHWTASGVSGNVKIQLDPPRRRPGRPAGQPPRPGLLALSLGRRRPGGGGPDLPHPRQRRRRLVPGRERGVFGHGRRRPR